MANDRLEHDAAILAVLVMSEGQTLFAPQVRAAAGMREASFEAAIEVLERQQRIVVETHSAPDPHLTGDWRSISLVSESRSASEAAEAGRTLFNRWVKEFLQHHRCT